MWTELLCCPEKVYLGLPSVSVSMPDTARWGDSTLENTGTSAPGGQKLTRKLRRNE